MTTTLTLGPVGLERAAFRELVRLAQHPQPHERGDGTAQSASLPPEVAAALQNAQPAPSPLSTQTITGSTR